MPFRSCIVPISSINKQLQYVCLSNYSPHHFERPLRISRPLNWLENHHWIYWGLKTHERSHVICDLHLCIPIPSIKVMKSPIIFSIGHLDRQFQTTYRSRGIFISKTDTFRQLWCVMYSRYWIAPDKKIWWTFTYCGGPSL
jgi:hypothetical protein